MEVQKLQLMLARDLYFRNPHGKWYYIVGDDMYVVAHHVLRMLEEYDHTGDTWLVLGPGIF